MVDLKICPGPYSKRIAALETHLRRVLEAARWMHVELTLANPATYRHELQNFDQAASAAEGVLK